MIVTNGAIIKIIQLTVFVKMRTNKSYRNQQNNSLKSKINKAARDILQTAKRRPYCPSSSLRIHIQPTFYEQAKQAETADRNLLRAALLYADAARCGQRVDSCIKDFASIVHQLGETKLAVNFLTDIRAYYNGDINKFDRLLTTLERQIKPSGKHQCKGLLLELPYPHPPSLQLLQEMFQNVSRIKSYKVYQNLCLDRESEEGKWLVLQFQSFSAAKKTLEKFKSDEWFGVNKFWLRGRSILCEATDGRDDFERGLVLSEDAVIHRMRKQSEGEGISVVGQKDLNKFNHFSIRLIQEDILLQAKEAGLFCFWGRDQVQNASNQL